MAHFHPKNNRVVGDELPIGGHLKTCLPDSVKETVTRGGVEALLRLVDSKHADATIKCQGREIRACSSVLAARCKFFDICFRESTFKESHSMIVNMDDDDPDALEAFIIYLQTASVAHIENWKVSYVESDTYYGTLPEGYLPFLIEVFRLADKYDEPILTGVVCWLIEYPDTAHQRWAELHNYYDDHPIDVLKALGSLLDMPDGRHKNGMVVFILRAIKDKNLAVARTGGRTEAEALKLDKQIQEVLAAHPSIATELLHAAHLDNRSLREQVASLKTKR